MVNVLGWLASRGSKPEAFVLSSEETFDVIVVGAGCLGVAAAYYIQKNSPDKRILLVERTLAVGQANTAMSAAAVRNMFASSTNQLLTDTSIKYFEHVQEEIGYDLMFEKTGYLWLLSEEQFNHHSVKVWMERMKKSGISYKVYNKQELKHMIPGLNVDFTGDEEAELMHLQEVDYGLFGADCGVLDPTRLVEYYFEKKKVKGVITDKGIFRADVVVLATGAWTNQLLDPIGIDSMTKGKKRQLFVIHAEDKKELQALLEVKGFNELGCIPFTILPSAGVYFRPQLQEHGFWIGCGDTFGREYKYIQTDDDMVPESAYYETSMYPVLSKYFPAFQGARPVNSWAGGYCYSPDRIPFVYLECGVLVVNGASGSGIMKADALGRIADAVYRGVSEAELFGGKKILSNTLSIKERNVEIESVII